MCLDGRPLFKDFWERFLWSLEQLRVKGQRTVYRLTLVKQWNMEEIDSYVNLIGTDPSHNKASMPGEKPVWRSG